MKRIVNPGVMVIALLLASHSATVAAPQTQFTITAGDVELKKGLPSCIIIVEISEGQILKTDLFGCGISRFTDNFGTDLGTKPAGKVPYSKTMPYFPEIISTANGRRIHLVSMP